MTAITNADTPTAVDAEVLQPAQSVGAKPRAAIEADLGLIPA